MTAAATLAVLGGTLTDGTMSQPLEIRNGRIATAERETAPVATIDADGLVVCPGFIDLQVNGGHGLDLAAEPESMWELGRLLPRHGVTSFLPTIVSSPAAVTDRAMAALARRPTADRGAEPLGLHFEGPMLNPERAGAHDPAHLIEPNPEAAARWTGAGGVTLVTLAPELPGAHALVGRLIGDGVTVSAGHTAATAVEADSGFNAGISMVTHLFNAMEPMGHRAPGLAGAALVDDRVTVGMIVDGVHVDPLMVKVAWRAKGPERVVLVTDAVAAMGLGPGRYELGDQVITADDTSVRNASGVLSGSVLTMDRAVANTMAFTGASLAEAVTAATSTPATVIGAIDRGHLGPGSVADLVLLDSDGTVAVTICRGAVAHVADGAGDRISIPEGIPGGDALWKS